jgi:monofunctional biosynthetic peptidoglycan transglycosylase
MRIRKSALKKATASESEIFYTWVAIEAISNEFLQVIWVTEDYYFFEHSGFDYKAIREAVGKAIAGKGRSGASTITMQCARSIFLWQGRSWIRKVLEAYYSIWMELFLSKKRILELYVNVIEFGPNIYGVEAASQHYFQIKASAINRDQAVRVVWILPSPCKRSPDQLNPSSSRYKHISELSKKVNIPWNPEQTYKHLPE